MIFSLHVFKFKKVSLPGLSLCRGVDSCRDELSPAQTFSRQIQMLARPVKQEKALNS